MQRLGKNHGGYHGETIDIRSVLRELKAAATAHGWAIETFYQIGDLELLALHRAATRNSKRETRNIYLSAGIHGDEPAGPLAALRLLQENLWPDDCEVWLLPCLNPTGYILNSRENEGRKDLNRDYRHLESEEVAAHVRWLERQPRFDLTLCLHEDWEAQGFYIYELNPDGKPALAEKMITAVAPQCPIDLSPVIEGRAAQSGIINPSLDPVARAQWPEAFWLIQHRTRQSCTLEAPSDFPLATRVNTLVAAVNAALTGAPSTASARC
jgi:hypothetical protein